MQADSKCKLNLLKNLLCRGIAYLRSSQQYKIESNAKIKFILFFDITKIQPFSGIRHFPLYPFRHYIIIQEQVLKQIWGNVINDIAPTIKKQIFMKQITSFYPTSGLCLYLQWATFGNNQAILIYCSHWLHCLPPKISSKISEGEILELSFY